MLYIVINVEAAKTEKTIQTLITIRVALIKRKGDKA